VESGGGLVEEVDGFSRLALAEFAASLNALGFAAGEKVHCDWAEWM